MIFNKAAWVYLVIVFCVSAVASVPSLSDLEGQITVKKDELSDLKEKIKKFDLKLQKFSQDYNQNTHRKEALSQKLNELKKRYRSQRGQVQALLRQVRKTTARLILKASKEVRAARGLLEKTVLERRLEILGRNAKGQLGRLAGISRQLEKIQKELNRVTQNQGQTRLSVERLEEKKNKLALDYVQKKKIYKQLEHRLAALVKRNGPSVTSKKKGASFGLLAPISSYLSVRDKNKGIALLYEGRRPVLSPAVGKIEHIGDLASLGKVIIIDHGKGIRSVILGRLHSPRSVGDWVSGQEVIGYTIPGMEQSDEIYFEVRKENKAQDPHQWIAFKKLKGEKT